MKLFDAHCHLQDERLKPDLDGTIQRARAAGVRALLCCGTREDDWSRVRDLAAAYPEIIPSFGLHPWYIGSRTTHWLERLREALEETPSAVGEIGLDHALKDRDDADMDQVFLDQLALARELDRPISIHCRRAWGRLQTLLGAFGDLPRGFMIHAYSGSAELIPWFVKKGAYLSFSGTVTRPDANRAWRNCRAVPPDRLLIETDAPDMMPTIDEQAQRQDSGPPLRQETQINEPANLKWVLRDVSWLRFESTEDMGHLTWSNASRLFRSVLELRSPSPWAP